MTIRKSLYSIVLTFAVIFYTISCSNHAPEVKPDKHLNQNSTNEKNSRVEAYIDSVQGAMSSIQLDMSLEEIKKRSERNLNHIEMIELACGHYHDSYNQMPLNPADLLNGFMFIWPGNVFTGKPIRILKAPPDPSNPADLGNVCYSRLNEHEATISFLTLDAGISTEDEFVWTLLELDIRSDSGAFIVHTTEKQEDVNAVGRNIFNLIPEERIRYGYRTNLKQALSFLMDDSLKRKGDLDSSVNELISDGNFYISEQGFKKLKEAVNIGDIYFSIGKYQDNAGFYIMCGDPYKEINPECKRSFPNKGEYNKIEYWFFDCPSSDKMLPSFFSSYDVKEKVLDIPDNLFIASKDVVNMD